MFVDRGGAPYPSAMANSYIRLFSGGKRLQRFFDRLEISLHEACCLEVDRLEVVHEGTLFHALRERFILRPIELRHLQNVILKPAPSIAGEGRKAIQAIARVSFSGSPVLLQLQPEVGFSFPFRGKDTKYALLLHDLLPDYDASDFVERVNRELERIRPLLSAFQPTIRAYDEYLVDRINAKIRSF